MINRNNIRISNQIGLSMYTSVLETPFRNDKSSFFLKNNQKWFCIYNFHIACPSNNKFADGKTRLFLPSDSTGGDQLSGASFSRLCSYCRFCWSSSLHDYEKNTFACRHFYRSCEFANHPFAAGESQLAGLSRSGLCSLHNGAALDASPGTRTGRSFRNAQHDASSTFQSAAPLWRCSV